MVLHAKRSLPVALILCLLLTACPTEAAKKKKKTPKVQAVGEETLNAGHRQVFLDEPDLDEEEQKSNVMPVEYGCDACKAISNTLVRRAHHNAPRYPPQICSRHPVRSSRLFQ